jgi:NAD(P)H dehydrogenase (quinone)
VPRSFFENSAGDVASARNEGKTRFQLHPLDRKFLLVATADIGKVGSETLTQGWTGIRHIEVAGPAGYSPLDIADAFADAVGRPVEAIAIPAAEWKTLWGSQGMPEERTAPRAEMVDGFRTEFLSTAI